jgi:hypothetical protein
MNDFLCLKEQTFYEFWLWLFVCMMMSFISVCPKHHVDESFTWQKILRLDMTLQKIIYCTSITDNDSHFTAETVNDVSNKEGSFWLETEKKSCQKMSNEKASFVSELLEGPHPSKHVNPGWYY